MGMFDSFYDAEDREWQTKAFDCLCDRYNVGDRIPAPNEGHRDAYQVSIFGPCGSTPSDAYDSFATIVDEKLVEVPARRDESLWLLDYCGGWIDTPKGDDHGRV
ncbi:hypothetical protein [Microbacterium sp. LWH12-1.2]|uniref:hypothetical protein n=1 Tax=Microbacterium sp. LWH12-1.2 TaxID=3135259 RepID=UPI00341F1973